LVPFYVVARQGGVFGIGVGMIGHDTARLAALDDKANDVIVFD